MNKEITILIPTINEEENIFKIIKLIKQTFKKITNKYEIIFIDDSSTDDTVKNISLLKKKKKNIILINSSKRLGLGNALTLGISKAKGKYILCLDCDCPVGTIQLRKIIKLRSKHSMVIGSRYSKDSKTIGFEKTKLFLSKIMNKFFRYLYNIPANDITHSLRIFYKKNKFIPRVLTHPGYFLEMSLFFKKEGKTFIEVPILYKQRQYKKSKNTLIKLFMSIIDFFFKIHLKNN